MNDQGKGCLRLFQIAGITVYLHWSWFLVAFLEITLRRRAYHSLAWNAAEYVVLFGIVLLHEFGHAMACRQVGGEAKQIVLWPLGGIAFVNPPPRPGALLWSIAAGPLVNVLLVPVTIGLCLLAWYGLPAWMADQLGPFCLAMAAINLVLLVFNLLPIYPLDGGQILYALVWFVLGRVRALRVASVLGMLGAAGLFLWALTRQSGWMIAVTAFLGFQAMSGWRQAQILSWLQPAVDHFNRALHLLQQGACAEAVSECDRALELIPPGHPLRVQVEGCRAFALAATTPLPAPSSPVRRPSA